MYIIRQDRVLSRGPKSDRKLEKERHHLFYFILTESHPFLSDLSFHTLKPFENFFDKPLDI